MTEVQAELEAIGAPIEPHWAMLLEQKYFMLASLDSGGDHLDNKAMGLIQAAGLIIALTGVVAIPSAFTSGNLSFLATVGIVVAFSAFICMIVAALNAWFPSIQKLPGTLDWGEMNDHVLQKDIERGYAQILLDCIDSIEKNQARNFEKAKWVKVSAVLLVLQVLGLLVVALF